MPKKRKRKPRPQNPVGVAVKPFQLEEQFNLDNELHARSMTVIHGVENQLEHFQQWYEENQSKAHTSSDFVRVIESLESVGKTLRRLDSMFKSTKEEYDNSQMFPRDASNAIPELKHKQLLLNTRLRKCQQLLVAYHKMHQEFSLRLSTTDNDIQSIENSFSLSLSLEPLKTRHTINQHQKIEESHGKEPVTMSSSSSSEGDSDESSFQSGSGSPSSKETEDEDPIDPHASVLYPASPILSLSVPFSQPLYNKAQKRSQNQLDEIFDFLEHNARKKRPSVPPPEPTQLESRQNEDSHADNTCFDEHSATQSFNKSALFHLNPAVDFGLESLQRDQTVANQVNWRSDQLLTRSVPLTWNTVGSDCASTQYQQMAVDSDVGNAFPENTLILESNMRSREDSSASHSTKAHRLTTLPKKVWIVEESEIMYHPRDQLPADFWTKSQLNHEEASTLSRLLEIW